MLFACFSDFNRLAFLGARKKTCDDGYAGIKKNSDIADSKVVKRRDSGYPE